MASLSYGSVQTTTTSGLRFKKHWWAVFALSALGLILTLESLVTPWQVVSATIGGVVLSTRLYIWGNVCESSSGSGTTTCSMVTSFPTAYVAAEALILFAILASVLGIVLSLIAPRTIAMKGGRGRLGSLVTGLGCLSAFVAPGMYAYYSYNNGAGYLPLTGGLSTAGFGWYYAFFAGLTLFVAFVLSLVARRVQRAGAAARTTGGPQQILGTGMVR